jgi:outer membrane protein assembly factor BamB
VGRGCKRNRVVGFALVLPAAVAIGSFFVSSAPASSIGSARGWHRSDLKPVTQPVAIDGRFVFYDGSGRQLHVVALDARTGKTVWSKLASVSDVTPGEPPSLDVSGSRVIALLGDPRVESIATVGAIDATTGKTVWESTPGRFTSTPSPCAADAAAVCATGSLEGGKQVGADLRFDVLTGNALAPLVFGNSIAGRELGHGLFDPALRNPDYLVAAGAKTILWRIPLANLYGAGSSSDDGWDFARLEKLGLFVGSVGFKPLKETKTFVEVDLAKEMTAGFRIADGSVVWRSPGAIFACGQMPCPGASLAGYQDQDHPLSDAPTVGVRLRMAGTLGVTIGSSFKFSVSRDANVVVQGFDLRTGRTLWSFDAARSVGLIDQTLLPPQSGANSIILRDKTGTYMDLNLRTGARHGISAAAPGWCRGSILYKQAVPYQAANHTITTYVGQLSLFPCLATSKRLETPRQAPTFVGAIGAKADGLVAWSDTTGVIAVPATP